MKRKMKIKTKTKAADIDMPVGKLKRVEDVLPSPSELVKRPTDSSKT